MRITKDEARILAAAMEEAKYELATLSFNFYEKLEELQNKLREFGTDQRRTGRTSMDSFDDCIRRFIKAK